MAYSCQAGDDVPASQADPDDPITVVGAATITIEAGATTVHDFAATAP